MPTFSCLHPQCDFLYSDVVRLNLISNSLDCQLYKVSYKGRFFCEKHINHTNITPSTLSNQLVTTTSPYLAPYLHCFVDPSSNDVSLIMDFLVGGSLDNFLQNNSLTDDDIGFIFVQLLTAIQDLRSVGIHIKQLKLSNILLESHSKPLRVKISDFVPLIYDKDTAFSTKQDIESIDSRIYSNRNDLYCVGLVLYMIYMYNNFSEVHAVSSHWVFSPVIDLLINEDCEMVTIESLLLHPVLTKYNLLLNDVAPVVSLSDCEVEDISVNVVEQILELTNLVDGYKDKNKSLIQEVTNCRHTMEVQAKVIERLTLEKNELSAQITSFNSLFKQQQASLLQLQEFVHDKLRSVDNPEIVSLQSEFSEFQAALSLRSSAMSQIGLNHRNTVSSLKSAQEQTIQKVDEINARVQVCEEKMIDLCRRVDSHDVLFERLACNLSLPQVVHSSPRSGVRPQSLSTLETKVSQHSQTLRYLHVQINDKGTAESEKDDLSIGLAKLLVSK
ncbi:hypothetical protein RCL1_000037 [Eukaryota sp. TZLM3-RCL]